VLGQTQQELGARVDDQTDKAAAALKDIAAAFHALAEGRAHEATRLIPYIREFGDRAAHYGGRLESGGIAGVGDDLTKLARRRPGMFLLGAVAAGVVAARLVRGAQKSGASDDEPARSMSTGSLDAPSPMATETEPYGVPAGAAVRVVGTEFIDGL
jgi:hypothetical protein